MFRTTRILLLALALSLAGGAGWPGLSSVYGGQAPVSSSPFGMLPPLSPGHAPNVVAAAATPANAPQQQAPTADFGADRVEIRPEMEIRFTDESTGTITSWLWDFGDGSTSTEQNPTHVYQKNGYYTVTLKVTGPNGSDTVKKVEFIRVSEDCNC